MNGRAVIAAAFNTVGGVGAGETGAAGGAEIGAVVGLLAAVGTAVFKLDAGTRAALAGADPDGAVVVGAALTGAGVDRTSGLTGVALTAGAPVAGRGAVVGGVIGTERGVVSGREGVIGSALGAMVEGVTGMGVTTGGRAGCVGVAGTADKAGGDPFNARVRSLAAVGLVWGAVWARAGAAANSAIVDKATVFMPANIAPQP